MLLCITVNVSYSPSRSVDIPWCEYLAMKRRQRLAPLRNYGMSTWTRKIKYNDTGGMTIRPRWFIKHKHTLYRVAIGLLLMVVTWQLFGTPIGVVGAVIDSTATGNASAGGTWVGGVAPVSTDDARIMNTHNVTIDVDGELWGSVEIQAGGTLTLTGTNKLILDDENGAGYAFDNDGTIVANTGILEFTYAGTTLCDFDGTGNPYDVIVNHATADIRWNTVTVIDNDLTITLGTFMSQSGTDDLTVTGDVDVTGTLGFGTFSAAVTLGSLTLNSGGTYIATSGVTTITSETAGGYAFNNDGTLTHNNGTLTFTYAGATFADFYATGSPYNVILNHASLILILSNGSTSTFVNDLTITAGELSHGTGAATSLTVSGNATVTGTWTTDPYSVGGTTTVTGDTIIDGTLTCNASTISLGSGNTGASYTVLVNGTGTLTGGSGAHTFGNIRLMNGSNWIATSSTTTLDGRQAGGTVLNFQGTLGSGSTFTHSNGLIHITSTVGAMLWEIRGEDAGGVGGPTFYDVNIDTTGQEVKVYNTSGDSGSAAHVTIANDFTITTGSYTCYTTGQAVNPLTVTGDVDVTGTLTGLAVAISLGSLTINSGGTYSATSGTTTITDKNPTNQAFQTISGSTFTHNNGTVTFDVSSNTTQYINMAGTGDFYNVIDANDINQTTRLNTAFTVANDFTKTSTGTFTVRSAGSVDQNVTVTGDVVISAGFWAGYTGTHSHGSLTINSGGTYSATSGVTTITSETAGGLCIDIKNGGATLTHNDGTFTIITPATTYLIGSTAGGSVSTFYNLIINHAAAIVQPGRYVTFDLIIANDLTITAGEFGHYGFIDSITIAGDVNVTGILDWSYWADITMGSMTINNGGEYDAATGTTTITSETAGGRAVDFAAGSTLTHNNGTITFSYAGSNVFTVWSGGNPYDVVIDMTTRTAHLSTDLTVDNDLTITSGTLDTSVVDYALTVTGGTSITGTLTCNSSTITVATITVNSGGTFTGDSCNFVQAATLYIASGGTFDASDASGSWTCTSNIAKIVGSTFNHNDGTLTHTGSNVIIYGNDLVLYNVVNSGGGRLQWRVLGAGGIEGDLTVSHAAGLFRVNNNNGEVDLFLGTASRSCTFTVTGTVQWEAASATPITLRAASSEYPVQFVGTGMDWDFSPDPTCVQTAQDIIFQDLMTFGGNGVIQVANRCTFTGGITMNTGDVLEGTMCTVDEDLLTFSGGLYIDGWFDPTDTARGGYNWILVGGDYTIEANLNYTTPHHFYKPGGATLTLDTGTTLAVTDCTVDGTYITAEADLLDTNNGGFTVRYNVDIKTTTIAGVAVATADVTCDDKDGNLLWTDATDGNGDIATQVTTYAVYGDGADINYPHNIDITKSGYIPLIWDVTIDYPMAATIPLMGVGSNQVLPLNVELSTNNIVVTVT